MPYIHPANRVGIDKAIENLHLFTCCDPGYLNYAITKLLHNQLADQGLSYRELNSMIGVLECVKLELYRNIGAPYENQKKRENGPVSQLDRTDL